MSKEEEARVRDELLQHLYRGVLHSGLSAAGAGGKTRGAAVAAAVCANLRREDVLLLPARGAESFRTLRGLPRAAAPAPTEREREAGVYTLPAEEPRAVAFALAWALAARRIHAPHAVCVVLPRRAKPVPAETRGQGRMRTPATWGELAHSAAKQALPVLFVSVESDLKRGAADPRKPAAAYPTIPVDAQDALALYRVAYECLGRARAQGGPSHLLGVRLNDGSPALERLEAMLRRRGCFTKAWQRRLERELVAQLAQ